MQSCIRSPSQAEFIIRGNCDRRLMNEEKKLKSKLNVTPVKGIVEFELPKLKNRIVTQVTQEIRAITVKLVRPALSKPMASKAD